MKILNRINKDLPDPIDSRRVSVSIFIRIFYAVGLMCIAGYFIYQFGRPLVFLEGTGIVTAPSYNVSVPYTAHIEHMNVISGIEVSRGDEIAILTSPEINRDIANLLSEISRVTEQLINLKIKDDIAAGSMPTAENRSSIATKSMNRFNTLPRGMHTVFETEQLAREASQATEALQQLKAARSLAKVEIAELSDRKKEMEQLLSKIRSNFNDGVVYASISGVISTKIAHIGDTIIAGSTIAEILDKKRLYIDWYIPNFRLFNPKVDDPVFIIFGGDYLKGHITEILPISNVIEGKRQSILREPQSGQIARVSLDNKEFSLPLDSSLLVRMNYIGIMDTLIFKIIDLWKNK